MELEALYLPYSRSLPAMYTGLQQSYSSYNSLHSTFELYWVFFLPLIVLGIPLCIACIPLEVAIKSFFNPQLALKTSQSPSNKALNPAWIIPKHMAVVMDGNRRYGRTKYGIPVKGHHEGSQRLVDFLTWSMAAGVKILTVYAFSTENWNREAAEVNALMGIFESFMKDIIPEALARNIRVCVLVSDGTRLPTHVKNAIDDIEKATCHCTAFTLNICASYGSRNEIVRACKDIAAQVKAGTLSVDDIHEDTISQNLLTKGLPDPDVLIRTSGELRLSNFLMYQIAYSELIFLDKMWPALTHDDFIDIVEEFNRRKRRFGK